MCNFAFDIYAMLHMCDLYHVCKLIALSVRQIPVQYQSYENSRSFATNELYRNITAVRDQLTQLLLGEF